MAGKLAGCTLFITGASRGIGKVIALRAAQDGANIVIAAKTTEPHPKLPGTIYTAAKEVEAVGGKCLPCAVDLRNDSQVEDAVKQAVSTFGGIDIVVNNASAIHLTGTVDTPMKRYDLMMDINTRGTFLTSKLCIPHLKKSRNPHILNICPPLDRETSYFARNCAYNIAKYGATLCVLGMAEELKSDGIAVNGLWPHTAVATAAVKMLGGDEAVRRCRKPEIMADAAYLILTSNSREVTGNFFIDEDVLRSRGITDLNKYAFDPGAQADVLIDVPKKEELHVADGGERHMETVAASLETPEGIFAKVQVLLSADLVKQVGATFLFVLDGRNSGNWFLDLKNDSGSIRSGDVEVKPDVTFKMDSDKLVALFKGEISPTTAVMSGSLKVSGSMIQAMSLEKLMGQIKSKL